MAFKSNIFLLKKFVLWLCPDMHSYCIIANIHDIEILCFDSTYFTSNPSSFAWKEDAQCSYLQYYFLPIRRCTLQSIKSYTLLSFIYIVVATLYKPGLCSVKKGPHSLTIALHSNTYSQQPHVRTKQKTNESTAKRALKYLNSEAGGISFSSPL